MRTKFLCEWTTYLLLPIGCPEWDRRANPTVWVSRFMTIAWKQQYHSPEFPALSWEYKEVTYLTLLMALLLYHEKTIQDYNSDLWWVWLIDSCYSDRLNCLGACFVGASPQPVTSWLNTHTDHYLYLMLLCSLYSVESLLHMEVASFITVSL